MWCDMVPTSPRVKRISGSKDFRSSPRKDFCNNIGTKRTYRVRSVVSALRGKAENMCSQRDPNRTFGCIPWINGSTRSPYFALGSLVRKPKIAAREIPRPRRDTGWQGSKDELLLS